MVQHGIAARLRLSSCAPRMVALSEFARSKHAKRIIVAMAVVGVAAVIWSSGLSVPAATLPSQFTRVAIFTAGNPFTGLQPASPAAPVIRITSVIHALRMRAVWQPFRGLLPLHAADLHAHHCVCQCNMFSPWHTCGRMDVRVACYDALTREQLVVAWPPRALDSLLPLLAQALERITST